jgi:uridine kinase
MKPMPSDRVRTVDALGDLVLAQRGSHPLRVAIDGPDAAGKTTLADELATIGQARGRSVIRASIDGFHRPRDERHRRGLESPKGYYLDSFDYDSLRSNLLLLLGPDGSGRYRTAVFDLRSDTRLKGPRRLGPADSVLLVDGVFLLRPELNDLWDLRVFVHVPPDEVLRRAMGRDRALFGSADALRRRYERRYIPGQRLYLAAVRPLKLADAVFENTNPASPRLLRGRACA